MGVARRDVVVGIGAEELADGSASLPAHLRSAARLAAAAGLGVRLVHVRGGSPLDQTEAPWLSPLKAMGMRIGALLGTARQVTLAEARERLVALVERTRGELGVADCAAELVEAEEAAVALLAKAAEVRAPWIALGRGSHVDAGLRRTFSTTLAVMRLAKLPVLVIGAKARLDLTRSGLGVVIADDLRTRKIGALGAAFDWVSTLDAPVVHHLHVLETDGQALRRAAAQLFAETHSSADFAEIEGELLRSVERAFLDRLEARAGGWITSLLKRGGRYVPAIRSGATVHDAVESFLDETRAEIAVFGHHEGGIVGRLPHHQMLRDTGTVVLVPTPHVS